MRRVTRAVLFDRDDTLVHDVPYNSDPDLVRPMPTAPAAVHLVRAAGIPLGVVTNQSGVGRGLFTLCQVQLVHRRVTELLGPFDTWQVCPHVAEAGCSCRKPAPGLVVAAAAELGVSTADVVVIGDVGADVVAALAAGARAVLVPTWRTRPVEVHAAPVVAPDLVTAVRMVMKGEA